MTYYTLKGRAEARALTSPAVLAYLERAKRKPKAIFYNPEWTPEGRKYERFRWVENVSHGLRSLGPVHELHKRHDEVSRFDHTGWFTDDDFQDETVHGIVYQATPKTKESIAPKTGHGQRVEDIDEEIKELRAGVLTLARELRANCEKLTGLDAIRAAIRARIVEVRRQCSKLAKERETIIETGLVEA